MAPEQPDLIYPCPFSKKYGIPVQLAWRLLNVFYAYRIIIASLFLILFFSSLGVTVIGKYDEQLYLTVSLGYLILAMLSVPAILFRLGGYTKQAQTAIFTDIIAITFLMHACGGIGSGFGILLGISIAAGGLLIGGRCAMLFAAIASLAVLAEQVYAMQTNTLSGSTSTYSGMLGASYFTIAYLSYVMAKRTEQSEQLASERQQTISRLEQLNRYIIQHLQSGIVLCDPMQRVQLCNEAVLNLAGLQHSPTLLTEISPQLPLAIQLWRDDPSQNFSIIQLSNGNEIQVHFSFLNIPNENLFMAIFEDIALYNQRLQQNKLASLGRLTASIAHEIRNPLGAISHAGQLLSEAPELSLQDKRLTEIIQNHCHRVNDIIENILKLSRRNPSIKEKISLDSWLPDYIENLAAELGQPRERFNIVFLDQMLSALIDAGHLKQILNNLCTNALKYGCQNAPEITLEVKMEQDRPCISVIDRGKGIDAATQQHLFEPFFTTSNNGTGLGLYISRELAELNQATLSYAYLNDKSCFTLCLPNANRTVIEI